MSRSWTRVNTLSSPPEGGEIFDRQNEEFSVGIDIALGRVLTQRQCQDYYCSFETGIHETILQVWGDLMATSPGEVTSLLHALRHGDRAAEEKLIPLV